MITFGKDIKVTSKEIHQTPGPSDYTTGGSRLRTPASKVKVRPTAHLRPSSRE